MKYEAVIFDMDGTILDTLEDLSASVNYALALNNFPICTMEQIKSFVGNGSIKLISRAIGKSVSKDVFQKVYNDYFLHYKKNCSNKTKAYNGVINLLELIRMRGMKTAIFSNKPDDAAQLLAKKYFDNLFDFVLGKKDNAKEKPYPDSLFEIIKCLNVQKDKCIYVGDSEVDIQTATNANIKCISVSWGFKSRDFLVSNNAKKIVDTIPELSNALLEN